MTITATEALEIAKAYSELTKQLGLTSRAALNQLGILKGTQLYEIVTQPLTASIYRAICQAARDRILVSTS